jgi:DNA-3-methyladenine glycosylase
MSGDADRRNAVPPGVRRSEHVEAPPPLPASFFARPATEVGLDLLGCLLVSEISGTLCVAEIVETEAYTGPDDEASHAHARFGVTPRNEVMFGAPGLAYVYRIYGIHACLNAVTDREGYPAAVLIRAARPIEGLSAIRMRRPGRSDQDLLRGPGNLCRGLGVGLECNRHPLQEPPLWIARGLSVPAEDVVRGPRVGISRAVEMPLRFSIANNPWVSR